MVLYLVLATAATISMALVVACGIWRWRDLERGAKVVLGGVAVFLAFSLVAAPLSRAGVKTRVLQEGPILVGTIAYLIGLALLQPRRSQYRKVMIAVPTFAVLWALAQLGQGTTADFSELSGPLHAATLLGAAGYTLVSRFKVTRDQWTSQTWYWLCIGLMVIYGTEVLLDPLMANVFGVRNDLVDIAYDFHQVGSISGYLMMTVGLVRSGAPARRASLAFERSSGSYGVVDE